MSWLDTLEEIQSRDFSKATTQEREKTAREVINLASYACAVTAVVPLPFSDALLMLPVQSAMVMSIGHIFGRKVERENAKEIILELGALAGASFLARQGIKAILPVFGAMLTVPAAFAANWAMGRVALEYFKNPGVSREQLRAVYEQAKAEGGKLFSRERFGRFRKEQEAESEASPAPKPAAPARKAASRPKAKKKAATSRPARRNGSDKRAR
jgi:uncharacterized protein (DUF697 family)